MPRPTILTVDDDEPGSPRDRAATCGALRQGLPDRPGDAPARRRWRSSPSWRCAAGRSRSIVADQRMPRDDGHRAARPVARDTPRREDLLLTAYADTDVAIQAINDIGLDYYLLKPWDPPEERLYPVVDDLLDDWRAREPRPTVDVRVVGHRWSERSHEVKTFLARNHVPYQWLDVEVDAGGRAARSTRPGRPATTCRWCWSRTASRWSARPRSTSPGASGCGRAPSSRSTTCASSARARPGSPPRCTPPRRG